jgi:hypothetical protein
MGSCKPRTCSYTRNLNSAGRSKKRKDFLGPGDGALEGAAEVAADGMVEETALESTDWARRGRVRVILWAESAYLCGGEIGEGDVVDNGTTM